MGMLVAEGLQKSYQVALKAPGLQGTIAHFWRRRYRTIEAVKSVSFSIAPGEVVGFLGANGAGKTTTLKMLAGLIYPSGGRVRVAGHEPFARESAFLHQIALVMGQKQQLIWDLPAWDSLRINGAVYGLSDRELTQRVGELSELLALESKLTQPVRKLSLGERMKAELLAALLHRPAVLFLDEPTLGLDVNAQANLRDFLREYNERYGATILLTSHYMGDITALCDRVLLIHEGSSIYDGSLSGLVDRFAPYREVRLELAQPMTTAQLQDFGEVVAIEGRSVQLLVRREVLTPTIARLLEQLPVQDLSVTEPPIEDIIGQVFRSGSATEAQPDPA
ncbi:MAG: ATP-binding cassette domain-containing protein [Limnothrix sp.]|uniref:ATP-binding cassette domain-containing protein n=1 Tax=Limnothrix redekei LRLZ20PSL1 TaxID=3112953 RepID=A0ABW7C846_9CYAN|nr:MULTISPECIES: ATP-binding cassette domain-containing protein [unclassified Limnothrix]MEB3118243.1 ATP-binding cassette domain-containing protein [Limnothrix sp.]MBD2160542.1 ATP-binding cassette domain-containing protein [Limnothrix sp. FACHB-1083]MBD2191244.1 ATP-binding cassette domain-containing protein [Limnothrix sp. FACHB-1088]MBD2552205.1 ATP-binding cassette domain-containing protein [Limnothrix sp. FACHB-708]MBD2592135.1 ATP-binding cassette domain-containing protein [Limnothrix s